MTWRHIAEWLNPQQHHCESLRSQLMWCCLKMLLKCLHSAYDSYAEVTHHAMTGAQPVHSEPELYMVASGYFDTTVTVPSTY